jgi:hypothetical protein
LETWPESLVTLRAREYAKCVENKGSPLDSVVAFIKGTGIEIARPRGTSQRATYSGHKDITVSSSKPFQLRTGWFSTCSVP